MLAGRTAWQASCWRAGACLRGGLHPRLTHMCGSSAAMSAARRRSACSRKCTHLARDSFLPDQRHCHLPRRVQPPQMPSASCLLLSPSLPYPTPPPRPPLLSPPRPSLHPSPAPSPSLRRLSTLPRVCASHACVQAKRGASPLPLPPVSPTAPPPAPPFLPPPSPPPSSSVTPAPLSPTLPPRRRCTALLPPTRLPSLCRCPHGRRLRCHPRICLQRRRRPHLNRRCRLHYRLASPPLALPPSPESSDPASSTLASVAYASTTACSQLAVHCPSLAASLPF